ncbi:MAG: putative bifunctional 2-polyprenylphenol hydroxylase/glutamate synthase subunit beta [bacterium ADurb.Bin429]|nr:MAG: putative bifunctional 2-polyprenylphenol hydroxylase/glutamate synthase subunit beta [bacterium ADurb.Bin429]
MTNDLTPKDRMAIDRQKMPEQDAGARQRTFTEVNLGFTEQLALLEARRCLLCKSPKCISGCPVLVPPEPLITGALGAALIGKEMYENAVKTGAALATKPRHLEEASFFSR